MKSLIIAEKSSVAGDIAKALGDGFKRERIYDSTYLERDDLVIASAVGHLVEILCPEEDDPGYDLARLPAIPKRFALGPIERTQNQLKMLGKLLHRKDIDLVINACDAGREGELIFRYIIAYHQCRINLGRMWLQSMTPASIMSAYADVRPAQEFDDLFWAAQSRSEADWLIGINGTRAISILYEMKTGQRRKYSVGRVQTVVTVLVVDRDEAIKKHVPRPYYEIHAKFSDGDRSYTAKWVNTRITAKPDDKDARADRFFDKAAAEAILARCQGHMPSSVKDISTDVVTNAPKLFDLTTLQREANKTFGFTAKRTLDLAQSLYDQKIITYPRTDADALPEDYIQTTITTLGKLASHGGPLAPHAEAAIPNVKPDTRVFNNAKISDHFAIIPSGQPAAGVTGDYLKLYEMIAKRFVAIFHPPAIHQRTVRETIVNGEMFRRTGNVLAQEGWLLVAGKQVAKDEDEESENGALCRLQPGEILPLQSLSIPPNLKTKAPKPYTEDTLLSAMETAGQHIENEEEREAMKNKGLGTPATRAGIIEKLVDEKTGYLVRDKKNILSTDKARDVVAFLRANEFHSLLSAKTTGEWEYCFKLMEKGQYRRDQFMQQIEVATRELVDRARMSAGNLPPPPPQSTMAISCPKCAQPLQATQWAYQCGCGVKLSREICGKRLTDEQIKTLAEEKSLPKISGFVSKAKKPFSAGLRLAADLSGKVEFDFT